MTHSRQPPLGTPPVADEIDEVLSLANPNPERRGCPSRAVLVALSRRELPIGDRAYEHLLECSECYCEFRQLQQQPVADSSRRQAWPLGRTIFTALAIGIAISGTWLFIRSCRARG
jgi:hypothetical protein